MKMTQLLVLLALCWPVVAQTETTPLILESGSRQVSLIELYTSEGCSSCPPADRWISQFVTHPDLWKRAIPLSFHVDYWNSLGWRDRFSSASYSNRQRRHKRMDNLSAVYTPGTLVNGNEWRGLLESAPFPAYPGKAPGNLKLSIIDSIVTLEFEHSVDADTADQRINAHLAILGTEIKSVIRRGENAGKTLTHNFVVLDHQQQQGTKTWQFSMPMQISLTDAAETSDTEVATDNATAVAAWLEFTATQQPIQAVGGWLNRDR
jgi:hypothetical protein